ncbi:MAG: ATP-binding protein [Verrucomicrobiota bacterium]
MTEAVLPDWSEEIRTLYLSGAANQFILSGNINDRLYWPEAGSGGRFGSLHEFLLDRQLAKFDVILTYDVGAGLRVNAGGEKTFEQWPSARSTLHMPEKPRDVIGYVDHYLRYCCNLSRAKLDSPTSPDAATEVGGSEGKEEVKKHISVAVIIRSAQLVIPASRSGSGFELNAMASVVRSWASETHFLEHNLATFLLTDNLNDLNPLLVNNPRVVRVRVPLPTADELGPALETWSDRFKTALGGYSDDFSGPAAQLAGATLSSVESLLRTKEYAGEALSSADLAALKKELVEKDCQGLIEFIESGRSLDDVHGHEGVKAWIREDVALWEQGDLQAMPMGYLLCGPVGTGKTYMVECLAGEAGVPVVKFKNFRDKWVGSTEGNLETIFRLLEALGRCVVFIDEADQALGSRTAGTNDSGVSGRVYSMMAKEMSDTSNRGRILWILASSRPDLIEVDLKRPGRVDVKIPLFPTRTPAEGYGLIRALCGKHGLELPEAVSAEVALRVPTWITPGAAESLAIKVYRLVKTRGMLAEEALLACLEDYQAPVARDVMEFQIGLAAAEASDLSFVPEEFRVVSG